MAVTNYYLLLIDMLASQMSLGNDGKSGHALKRKRAPATTSNTSASLGPFSNRL